MITVDELHVVFAVFAVQKEEVQRIEQMNTDSCLHIEDIEHCICTRDSLSSHLNNT